MNVNSKKRVGIKANIQAWLPETLAIQKFVIK